MMRNDHAIDTGWATDPATATGLGAATLAAAVAGSVLARRRTPSTPQRCAAAPIDHAASVSTERAARRLHLSAALLSLSVVADSGVEHYRASFDNPGMVTPLVVGSLALTAGLGGAVGSASAAGRGAYAVAAAAGVAGTAFHVYNVLRKPGGLNWLNAFYAAPLGAPAALVLAGAIGLAAGRLNPAAPLAGVSAGRALAALTGAGLLGTVGEAGLMHFRGAFQNPAMWLPVSLPPVAAALMLAAAVAPPSPRRRAATRGWLWLTAGLGLAGVGFHAYGISRAMGGWRNWRQNVVDGPPLPAPPAFAALALAGLAALDLQEHGRG